MSKSIPTPAEVYEAYRRLGTMEAAGAEFGRKKSWASKKVNEHRAALTAAEGGSPANPEHHGDGADEHKGDGAPDLDGLIDRLIDAAARRDLAPTQIRALMQARAANLDYKVQVGELVTAESLRGTMQRVANCVDRVFSQAWALGLATSVGADPAQVTQTVNRAVNQLMNELEAEVPQGWQ